MPAIVIAAILITNFFIIIPTIFTEPVKADIGYLTIRPDGQWSTWYQWNDYPDVGNEHWQNVDEAVADGDTTMLNRTVAAALKTEVWTMEDHTTEVDDITSVTVYFTMKASGWDGGEHNVEHLCGNYSISMDNEWIEPTSDYAVYSKEYTTSPTDGQPWDWDEVDNMQLGVSISGSVSPSCDVWVTQAYAVVKYGSPSIVWVDDDADPGWYDDAHVATIEEGITAIVEYNTVYVYDGTYQISAVTNITKEISIRGNGSSTTIIDAMQCPGDEVFSIEDNNINISGFEFINMTGGATPRAIYTLDADYLNVSDCVFEGGADVIYLDVDCSYADVYNCMFNNQTDGGAAIYIKQGSYGVGWGYHEIKKCIFQNCKAGAIKTHDTMNNDIIENDFTNCSGIDSAATYAVMCLELGEVHNHNNEIYHNNFFNNDGGRNGIDDGTLSGNKWNESSLHEGNYYSNFDEDSEGAWDNDSDGIVDYVYTINGTAGEEDGSPFRIPYYAPAPPGFASPSPSSGATGTSINLVKVSITISDINSDTFNWTIGGENITTNSSNDDVDGVKNASVISPLQYLTEYTWWVNATDGEGYTNESYTFTTEHFAADVVYVDDDYTVATEGWHIDKYDAIVDALTAVNESGTIYVYAGEYGGNLVISKIVSLVGMTGAYYSGRDSIIVDGAATGNVIAVSANYVNISGLTIKDGDYGIYLNGADYVQIMGNVIKDNTDTGITFINSDNALIKENNFSSSGVWIVDSDSDNIAVYHNNFLDSLPLEDGGGTGNSWNLSYPRGGNYYDDYSDTFDDAYQGKGQNVSGSDGLGDNIWNLGRDGVDYYPLFNPYVFGNKRPYVYNSSPVDNIGDVLVTLSSVSIYIEDLEGDSFDWYFETSPDIGSTSGIGAGNGTKTIPFATTPLPYFTTITWYVNVTDGGGWTNTTHVFKTQSQFVGSIQDAIDAASDGDTILIYRGYFEENIAISKSLTLIGEYVNDTIIDGGGSGDVVSITADDVIIQNLTITNSGATGAPDFDSGIDVGNKSSVQIRGSNVSNNKYGIYMNGAQNIGVLNNILDSNSHCGISGTNVISGSFSNNYIRNNTNYALIFTSCSQNYVRNNVITGNDVGIYSSTNGSGNIYLGNTISNNTGIGIWLEIENGGTIANNTIASNLHGILLYNAIPEVHTCDGNIITDNTIASNDGIGVWLHGASFNLIGRNNISGNDNKGIDIYWMSKNNEIYENDIYGYDYVNSIPDKQSIGLLVRPGVVGGESSDNFVYHNSFYGNVVQIMDSESTESTFSERVRPNDDEGTNEWEGNDADSFCLTPRDMNFGDDAHSCSDATYIYTSCGASGLKAYTFDGSSLEIIATWNDYSAQYGDIWCDGTFIYVVWNNIYLRAFTFDGTEFALIASFYMEYEGDGIWGDGTYIYVAQKENGFSIYTFDGTRFGLSVEWDAYAHGELGSYTSIWGDGTYIYVASADIYIYTYEYSAFCPTWDMTLNGWLGYKAQNFVDNWDAWGYLRYTGPHSFSDLSVYPYNYKGTSPETTVVYGLTTTYIEHNDIRAFTFDGTSLSYKEGIDVGNGCTDIWGDGTYIYAACSQNLMAYTFNGTSFTFKDNQEMSDFKLEHLWSDESGNVYVSSQRPVDFASRISVYTLDAGNFTLMDEIEEEIIGSNDILGSGNSLYLTNSLRIFAFTRFGVAPHYILVNEKIIDYGEEYIYCLPSTAVGSKELYEIYSSTSYNAANYGNLESVTITAHIQMETAAGASGSFDLIISDGENEQTDHHDIILGDDWREYSSTFLATPSGEMWDWNDLPNLKIGLALGNGVYADSQPKMTQIYLDFNYTKGQYNRYNDTYPSGGNYFDDFDEESEGAYDRFRGPNQNILGPDGIVDGNSQNPYAVQGVAGSRDMYPLLYPYSSVLKADFDYMPKNPLVGQRISFSSKSSGYIVLYEWNFGDGTSTKGESAFHIFNEDGFYTVTLKVTDIDGNTDSISKIVPVRAGVSGPVVIPPLQPPKYPNNPFSIPEMYQLLRANVPSDSKIVIVTIDSGNYPQVYEGVDLNPIINLFHSSYPDGIDTFGHGSWVSYAIRYGIQEFCPNSVQYSIRAFDGRGQSTPDIFLQCLDMAKDLNPDIVSISAGIIGTEHDAFSKKVSELVRAGIFVTVSAGNSGPRPSTITSPAIGADAVAIGAIDPMLGSILDLSDDEVTEWSSRGPIAGIFPKPDFTAPGESIIGPWLEEEKIASGTSMSAPLIAASALQIMAANKWLLDAVQFIYGNQIYLNIIETSLIDSAYDKGDPNSYGWGIPNTQEAVRHAWLKAVWYIIIFVISIIILVVSILLIWKWTKGEKKRRR